MLALLGWLFTFVGIFWLVVVLANEMYPPNGKR